MKEFVDFHHVDPRHEQIHLRLENWKRWVRVRPRGWQTHPMFRLYRSKRQHETDLHIPDVINILDAVEIEKAVSRLPEKNRYAIRWSYVFCTNVIDVCRALAVSKLGLSDLVAASRDMLKNTAAR